MVGLGMLYVKKLFSILFDIFGKSKAKKLRYHKEDHDLSLKPFVSRETKRSNA